MIAMQRGRFKSERRNSTLDMRAIVLNMKRMQIQLTDDQARALEERAAASRRPVAAVVRDAIDALIAVDERHLRHERALAAIGGFHSGLGDLAERHDDYLDGM